MRLYSLVLNRVVYSWVISTKLPEEVGVLGLPRLTGKARTSAPFWYTRRVLSWFVTTKDSLGPIVTLAARSVSTKRPPPGTPPSAARTVSRVPGCQYAFGR